MINPRLLARINTMLVEQIAYREHYLIGRRQVLEVTECGKMSLTVHCVIGVMSFHFLCTLIIHLFTR